jgi:microcystin-dependent protein
VSDPYIGEIRMFAGNFAPINWAFCNGQLLPISEYDALFALLGTTYGGDGQTTFGLPDLQGRLPVHAGQGPGLSPYVLGQRAGVEQVTLTTPQLPAHTHAAAATTNAGSQAAPGGAVWAATTGEALYATATAPTVAMDPTSPAAPAGGNLPHSNLMPYQCVNFIIALFGIFPQQS